MVTLARDWEYYNENALAVNTYRVYNVAFSSYLDFCHQTNIRPLPASETSLSFYVCAQARRISYSSIVTYLSGIQYHISIRGYHLRLSELQGLYYLMRGIRRSQANLGLGRPARLPVTLDHLAILIPYIHRNYPAPNSHMLAAAVLVAFFGLLRSSEYTSRCRRAYESTNTLMSHDVTISNNIIYLHIKTSKTDPFRRGCTIKIGSNPSSLCPVSALRTYLNCRDQHQGPLFSFSDGSYLTRQVISDLLSRCFPDVNLSSHSLRIGGASRAASIGLPDSVIRLLGRWSSGAYLRYIILQDTVIAGFSSRLVGPVVAPRNWNSLEDKSEPGH